MYGFVLCLFEVNPLLLSIREDSSTIIIDLAILEKVGTELRVTSD